MGLVRNDGPGCGTVVVLFFGERYEFFDINLGIVEHGHKSSSNGTIETGFLCRCTGMEVDVFQDPDSGAWVWNLPSGDGLQCRF